MTNVMTQPTIDISPLMASGRALRVKEEVEIPEGVRRLEDGVQPEEGHVVFRILHPEKGDDRLTWDPMSLLELQGAKKLFMDLVKKGLKPFKVGVDGKATAEAMSRFDPRAGEVMFLATAMIAGG